MSNATLLEISCRCSYIVLCSVICDVILIFSIIIAFCIDLAELQTGLSLI